MLLPGDRLRPGVVDARVAEHVRMAALHLVADRVDHVVEHEGALLARHLRMEHDLKQQIAQFVAQRRQVVALDRIRNFVRLLDRVRRDGAEVLFEIPWAAALRIAQAGHDGEEAGDGHTEAVRG